MTSTTRNMIQSYFETATDRAYSAMDAVYELEELLKAKELLSENDEMNLDSAYEAIRNAIFVIEGIQERTI